MAGFETYLNECCVHCRVRGVNRGEAGVDTDIGNDHRQIALRNCAVQEILETRNLLLRLDQPGSRWRLHIDDELAGVRSRKEREFKAREQQQASCEADGENDEAYRRSREHDGYEPVVHRKKPIEAAVEPSVESLSQAGLRAVRVTTLFSVTARM